jgi:replicative DNA helicase
MTTNTKLEMALLGGIISDTTCQHSKELLDEVSETDFTELRNKYLFRFVKRMVEQDLPVDALALAEKLDDAKKLESVGGYDYIKSLNNSFDSRATLKSHAKKLSDLRIKRDLIQVSLKLNNLINDKADNASIISEIEEDLKEISLGTCGTAVEHIKMACGDWLDELDNRIERGGGINGLSTGFPQLDDKLGGLGDESLVTIVGRPSHGKTLFSQAICQNVGITQNKGVLFFSMEMSKLELYERFVSGVGNVNPNKLRTADIDPETQGRIEIGVTVLERSKIHYTCEGTQSLGQIRAKTRRHKAKFDDLSLIVIDHLGFIELDDAPRHDLAIGKVTKGLKRLAKEMKVPVILICQAGRNLDKVTSPTMSDIKDSSAIEADSDVVIFVNRPEVTNPETELKGITEIIIAKDRHNSSSGTILMEKRNGNYSELTAEAAGKMAMAANKANAESKKVGM